MLGGRVLLRRASASSEVRRFTCPSPAWQVPPLVASVTSSFLFLVVWPGAPSSVLAPSSDALCY